MPFVGVLNVVLIVSLSRYSIREHWNVVMVFVSLTHWHVAALMVHDLYYHTIHCTKILRTVTLYLDYLESFIAGP